MVGRGRGMTVARTNNDEAKTRMSGTASITIMCANPDEFWYIKSKEKRGTGGEGWEGNEVAGEGGREADRMEKEEAWLRIT